MIKRKKYPGIKSKITICFFLVGLVMDNTTAYASSKAFQITKSVGLNDAILYQRVKCSEFRDTQAHVLYCDLSDPALDVQHVLGGGKIAGARESVESLARSHDAVAGVNISYYGYWNTETPIGGLWGQIVEDGELVSSINPLHVWQEAAIGITTERQIITSPALHYKSEIKTDDGESFKTLHVNCLEWDDTKDQILVFTDKAGSLPVRLDQRKGVTLTLIDESALKINTLLKAQVKASEQKIKIPEKGDLVLYGSGKGETYINQFLKPGKQVTIQFDYPDEWSKSDLIIGSGPLVIHEGKITIENESMEHENRTALGVIGGQRLVVFCVRDVTWYETAQLMKSLGVQSALMVDGGGSTSLVINKKNVFEKQRAVGDALLFYYRAASGDHK